MVLVVHSIFIVQLFAITLKRFSLTRGQFHKLVCTLPLTVLALRPTFGELFSVLKVWHRAGKIWVGGKTVYEIDPKSISKHANKFLFVRFFIRTISFSPLSLKCTYLKMLYIEV